MEDIIVNRKEARIICEDILGLINSTLKDLNCLEYILEYKEDTLFMIEVINDQLKEMENKVVDLQQNFTTIDEFFINCALEMEKHLEDKRLGLLKIDCKNLIDYLSNND